MPKWIDGRCRMTVGQLGEHPARVREHELAVVGRRQRAGPRVEQLERPRPMAQLGVDERDRRFGQAIEHRVEQGRVGAHQRLGVAVVATRPALDQVAGHRERRSGEGEQGHVGGEFGGQQVDGVDHVADVVGFERPQAAEVCGGAQGVLDDRPGSGGDVDPEPHGVGRHHDVAVQHGGVDPVAADRLERDLGRQLRLLDGVEDRALAAHRPVFGEAAPCLAHEPHRGVRCRPARRGSQKRRVEIHATEDAISADRVTRPPFRRVHRRVDNWAIHRIR